ncbi:hypothetical protein RJT34_31196 [Clitoria ternatea]|uniref:Uncharacterized protein n=1 Tax=Clitoria ternatea TaxID=43366 RepID=A0AAN9I150_CLITE
MSNTKTFPKSDFFTARLPSFPLLSREIVSISVFAIIAMTSSIDLLQVEELYNSSLGKSEATERVKCLWDIIKMGRAPCCENKGSLKKGPWTPEEDLQLINYIHLHGPANWRTLPKNAGLRRCGKSCRLRWANYLRPDIKRGRFSLEEEDIIIQLHSVLGNKWSAIAGRLPGRTDNEIKNYWNTHIRKRLLQMGIDPVTHTPRLDLFDISSILRSVFTMQGLFMNPNMLNLATTPSLLSLKNDENHDLASQNTAQTQVSPPLEFTQFHVPTQITNEEGLFGNMGNLGCSNHVLQQNQVGLFGDMAFVHSLNNANQNMGHDSVPPTPKELNSSSIYVNCGTEEERDSYCSDLFNFEIPETLNIGDIFCSVPPLSN